MKRNRKPSNSKVATIKYNSKLKDGGWQLRELSWNVKAIKSVAKSHYQVAWVESQKWAKWEKDTPEKNMAHACKQAVSQAG